MRRQPTGFREVRRCAVRRVQPNGIGRNAARILRWRRSTACRGDGQFQPLSAEHRRAIVETAAHRAAHGVEPICNMRSIAPVTCPDPRVRNAHPARPSDRPKRDDEPRAQVPRAGAEHALGWAIVSRRVKTLPPAGGRPADPRKPAVRSRPSAWGHSARLGGVGANGSKIPLTAPGSIMILQDLQKCKVRTSSAPILSAKHIASRRGRIPACSQRLAGGDEDGTF